jgi:hypothetical protein
MDDIGQYIPRYQMRYISMDDVKLAGGAKLKNLQKSGIKGKSIGKALGHSSGQEVVIIQHSIIMVQ